MTDHAADDQPADAMAHDPLRNEADLISAGLSLQTDGLKLLLAEMQGLAALMTPVPPSGASPDATTDAEVEAGFDNMPV